MSNGLLFLEIETQSGYKDENQAFAAGVLEGSLTWMNIYSQWKNTILSFCEKNEANRNFCVWLHEVIGKNYNNIQMLSRTKHASDHYHHQIFLFYQQLLGIESGFRKGARRARRYYEIPFIDLLLLNSRVDIEDLKIYYNEYVVDYEDQRMEITPCLEKMVLKILRYNDSYPNVLIGHTSDGDYSGMLKIVKTYRFNYHLGPEDSSHLVTNTDITFTSYPGSIASSDDFYLAIGKHSRVIIAGIALKHQGEAAELLNDIDFDHTILLSPRVMAANRLAQNGRSWAHVMVNDPDLGAKQWLVIDEKHLKFLTTDEPLANIEPLSSDTVSPFVTLKESSISQESTDVVKPAAKQNLIWLVDQTWGRLHAEDVTDRFINDRVGWFLDGTPFFKVIQDLNGYRTRNHKVNKNMETANDLVQFLKRNAYRGDLMEHPTTFGNIDIKVYESEDRELIVQNGPVLIDPAQPFDWNSSEFEDIDHHDHPSLWNFSPIQVQFLWN